MEASPVPERLLHILQPHLHSQSFDSALCSIVQLSLGNPRLAPYSRGQARSGLCGPEDVKRQGSTPHLVPQQSFRGRQRYQRLPAGAPAVCRCHLAPLPLPSAAPAQQQAA